VKAAIPTWQLTSEVSVPTAARAPTRPNNLLLEVGVPFRLLQGQVHLETQAHQGVRQWLANFDRVTLCAAVVPETCVDPSMDWTPAGDLVAQGLSIQLFPWSYHIHDHVRNVGNVRRIMRELIPLHTHLCFTTLGWLGMWGSVGCEESRRLGRKYAIWLDWVLHEMPSSRASNPVLGVWKHFQAAMLKRQSLRDVAESSLGLFNGRSVYDGYAAYCRVPRVAHNIHMGLEDLIPTSQLLQRLERKSDTINLICVGRVHEMKGPRHWLTAIQSLLALWRGKRSIRATWLGTGPMIEEMRQLTAQAGLSATVSFPGHQSDRKRLLDTMREADAFVFCNLAPESPRSLIEALMCGLPVFGFESAFALDVLGAHTAAGAFVPVGDTEALARSLAACLDDSAKLRRMALAGRNAGAEFSEEAVFRHRSDLIKEFL